MDQQAVLWSQLYIYVGDGRDLKQILDPYLEVCVGHKFKVRTRQVKGKQDSPLWAENFHMSFQGACDYPVVFTLWAKTKRNKSLLGQTVIEANELKSKENNEAFFPLQSVRSDKFITGDIHIRMKYKPPTPSNPVGNIYVKVIEGRNLAAKSREGASDPYVKMTFQGHSNKTKAVKKNLNPSWNQEFDFSIVSDQQLGLFVFTVWDSSTNSFMGRANIRLSEYGIHQDHDLWLVLQKDAELVETKEHIGDIRIRYKYFEEWVLSESSYKPLIDFLNSDDPTVFDVMGKYATVEREDLSKTLVNIFEALHPQKSLEFVKSLAVREIRNTEEQGVLFRANTLCTKAVDAFLKKHGSNYLSSVMKSIITEIYAYDKPTEMDGTRIEKQEDLPKNFQNLLYLVDKAVLGIIASASSCPSILRQLFHCIQQTVREKSNWGEDVQYTSVSGFLFLRFFCPAILAPKLFNLADDHPEKETNRTLTLISKTIQNLANLIQFGYKEPYMSPMNDMILNSIGAMKHFIDQVCTLPEETGDIKSSVVFLPKELAHLHFLFQKNKDKFKAASEEPIIQQILELMDKLDQQISTAKQSQHVVTQQFQPTLTVQDSQSQLTSKTNKTALLRDLTSLKKPRSIRSTIQSLADSSDSNKIDERHKQVERQGSGGSHILKTQEGSLAPETKVRRSSISEDTPIPEDQSKKQLVSSQPQIIANESSDSLRQSTGSMDSTSSDTYTGDDKTSGSTLEVISEAELSSYSSPTSDLLTSKISDTSRETVESTSQPFVEPFDQVDQLNLESINVQTNTNSRESEPSELTNESLIQTYELTSETTTESKPKPTQKLTTSAPTSPSTPNFIQPKSKKKPRSVRNRQTIAKDAAYEEYKKKITYNQEKTRLQEEEKELISSIQEIETRLIEIDSQLEEYTQMFNTSQVEADSLRNEITSLQDIHSNITLQRILEEIVYGHEVVKEIVDQKDDTNEIVEEDEPTIDESNEESVLNLKPEKDEKEDGIDSGINALKKVHEVLKEEIINLELPKSDPEPTLPPPLPTVVEKSKLNKKTRNQRRTMANNPVPFSGGKPETESGMQSGLVALPGAKNRGLRTRYRASMLVKRDTVSSAFKPVSDLHFFSVELEGHPQALPCIIFHAEDQRVHLIYWTLSDPSGINSNRIWVDRDLCQETNAPIPAGDLSFTLTRKIQLVYRGSDNHIHQLTVNKQTGECTHTDLSIFDR